MAIYLAAQDAALLCFASFPGITQSSVLCGRFSARDSPTAEGQKDSEKIYRWRLSSRIRIPEAYIKSCQHVRSLLIQEKAASPGLGTATSFEREAAWSRVFALSKLSVFARDR